MYVVFKKIGIRTSVLQVVLSKEEGEEYLSNLLNIEVTITPIPLDITPLDIWRYRKNKDEEYLLIHLSYSVNEILDEYIEGYLIWK